MLFAYDALARQGDLGVGAVPNIVPVEILRQNGIG